MNVINNNIDIDNRSNKFLSKSNCIYLIKIKIINQTNEKKASESLPRVCQMPLKGLWGHEDKKLSGVWPESQVLCVKDVGYHSSPGWHRPYGETGCSSIMLRWCLSAAGKVRLERKTWSNHTRWLIGMKIKTTNGSQDSSQPNRWKSFSCLTKACYSSSKDLWRDIRHSLPTWQSFIKSAKNKSKKMSKSRFEKLMDADLRQVKFCSLNIVDLSMSTIFLIHL